MSRHCLLPKIASEEYCCVYGYLRLCKARGESYAEMAKSMKVSYWTIKYNFRKMREEKFVCQQYSDCMKSSIEEVEALIASTPKPEE
jgi:hypothetical protein